MAQEALGYAIRDLVIANRILANENVLDGFGHVSIRNPERPDRYFMSRSRSPALVTRDDLIEFTLDNDPIDLNGRAIYAERAIHGSIYRLRPEVGAICHNHSNTLIPFGISDVPLRPVLHMASVIGSRVPVFDIHDHFGDTDLLVTNREKGDALAGVLGQGRVALMRGHGSVVAGRSLRETVFVSVYLQVNAGLQLSAHSLGHVKFLTEGEVQIASDTLLSPLSQNRAWDYWCARAGYSGI